MNALFKIVIERWIDLDCLRNNVIYDTVSITRDVPQRIRVQVVCTDCGLTRAYAAFNPAIYQQIFGTVPRSAEKWPAWLLNRLIPLRAQHPAVQEACLACRVPPTHHASWELPS